MPPRKKANKRKIANDSDNDDELQLVQETKKAKRNNAEETNPLIDYERSSDDFVKWMHQTIKKLKDENSLRKLFSDEITPQQKELSINVVKHLKQVTDEFLVSVMQADMFMKSNSIQTINHTQDTYFLYRLDLPELWAIIFSYLPISDFIHINRVCKLWKQSSELPQALVHYAYPNDSIYSYLSPVKSEKLFFERYIQPRIDSIKTYSLKFPGIENMVKKHNMHAVAESKAPDSFATLHSLSKNETSANCLVVEKTDTVYDKLVSLNCRSSPFLLNVLANSAMKQFPALKHLILTSNSKKTKEVTVSHPSLNSITIYDFSNIVIQCPMLEKCIIQRSENVTIESKQLSILDLRDIGALNLKEPTMAWDLKDLENVKAIVKLDCPFVKRCYINHESMMKYLPNLVTLYLSGELIGYECLKKLPSTNQCLKEITCRNFKHSEGLDEKLLKKALQGVEHVKFDDCGADFVTTILNSLSDCVRGITFSKIAFTKTMLDVLDISTMPNLHILKIINFTKTSLKPAIVEKMLKRMTSINNLTLSATKTTDLGMDIPDHIDQLELNSLSLSGNTNSKKLFLHEIPKSGTFKNAEFLVLNGYYWENDLDLPLLKTQMPSLECVETSLNTELNDDSIEFIITSKVRN